MGRVNASHATPFNPKCPAGEVTCLILPKAPSPSAMPVLASAPPVLGATDISQQVTPATNTTTQHTQERTTWKGTRLKRGRAPKNLQNRSLKRKMKSVFVKFVLVGECHYHYLTIHLLHWHLVYTWFVTMCFLISLLVNCLKAQIIQAKVKQHTRLS